MYFLDLAQFDCAILGGKQYTHCITQSQQRKEERERQNESILRKSGGIDTVGVM